MTKTLRITNMAGKVFLLDNLKEYVCGYEYFYLRFADGTTSSVARTDIQTVERLTRQGEFCPVHLMKPKIYVEEKPQHANQSTGGYFVGYCPQHE